MKDYIGQACVVLAVCLGIGGCTYLVNLSEAKLNESKRQIYITNSFNSVEKPLL